MSEDVGQDKTEEPTGRREEKFREDGRIPRSQEISTLATLLGAMALVSWTGPKIASHIGKGMEASFNFSTHNFLGNTAHWVKYIATPVMFQVMIVLIGILMIALLINLAQVGISPNPSKLAPNTQAINPFSAFKKLFSPQSLLQFIKSFLKVFVIGYIAYMETRDHLGEIIGLSELPLTLAAAWTLKFMTPIIMKIGVFMTVIAIGDYTFNWFKIHKEMMMTKQEVKEEMKEAQVSEHVKSKVRQIQRERAKRVIHQEVPKATVIITNPTHFAIALRYRKGIDAAPKVVAKGADYMAAIIREVAAKNNVPLYEYPELARALYRKVKVGKNIPEEHYEGVAKVLAFIFQMYRRRQINKGKLRSLS